MDGNRNPTQRDQIKAYLEQHGSITAREAMTELGCMRLGARIYELKHDFGMNIKKSMETALNRNGVKVSYARYTLEAGNG